ncbi:MAG: aminomethyltransferase family protein, partial [Actinomycetota bacterium]
HSRQEALGAEFYDARGWERPQWYEHNAPLVERYGLAPERPAEWDNRWWSPIQEAEHLALRDAVGMVDLSAFQIFDLEGPGALDYIQYLAVNQCDVAVGRSIYTPFLTQGGGFHSDLTILRLADDHFRVVTGAFDGGRDEFWIRRHQPTDGSVTVTNRTMDICTIGVWGPNAPALLAEVSGHDTSQEAFPYGTTAELEIAGVTCRAFRISYVGDAGWEIYIPWEQGPAVWDALWETGQGHGVLPVGIGVYGTSGRIEKGYRLMGAELESEYTPVEAGLARPRVKAADFIGKEPYLAARAEEAPAAILCTLTVEDHADATGRPRYMTGGNEPILTADGDRIVDRKGRVSRVTTAGMAPSLGAYLLMAYLPPEHAVEGTDLQVMYMNELFPVRVARAGSRPLFDPDDTRMKGS